MPCRTDHLEPTWREIASKEQCEILCYLLTELGQEVPEWAATGASAYYGSTLHLDDSAEKICGVIRGMDEAHRDKLVFNGRIKVARMAADFWEKHQQEDAARAARLLSERKREEVEFERLRVKLGR